MPKLTVILIILAHISSCLPADDKDKAATESGSRYTVISGLKQSKLPDLIKGRILVEEHRCIACHATDYASLQNDSKQSPRLSEIGKRVNPHYLKEFILSPQTMKPGSSMPHVLDHLDPRTRENTATALTHFLLSLAPESNFRPQVPDRVAADQGKVLFHSVGCVACHSPRDAEGNEQFDTRSTPMGDLVPKYNVSTLTQFLTDPHRVRRSGRMPSLNLSRRDYERISHYLLQKTKVPGKLQYTLIKGRVWEGLDINVERIEAGHVDNFDIKGIKNLSQNSAVIYEGYLRIENAGVARFFLEWNGGELWINDKKVLGLQPSSRRGVKRSEAEALLALGWNRIKLVYIHAGRDPKFNFEILSPGSKRQTPDSSLLSISSQPITPYQPLKPDPTLVPQGARAFVQNGCVKCHQDVQKKIAEDIIYQATPPLSQLDKKGGCLSAQPNPSPRFGFSDQQISLIVNYLQHGKELKLQPQDVVNKSLVTFNCLACHDREGLGGVDLERNQWFAGTNNELGNDGRIPPPLTLVGAKLQKQWTAEVLLRGGRQRQYLATRMPQFGESNVGHLIELFEQVDAVEKVKFEEIQDREQVKQAGKLLIGTRGFSCIACHDFNGQKAAGPGAMDIIHSASRLKKDWFYLFMLKPNRFRKGTIMPESWPGGHVFMEEVLNGDAKKQIESLWVYLEDGIRASNPEGLSRKSPELRVTDEAIICRGRGTAGYRGLGVGYPERLSLAFDTQEMNLRLLWKGEFATVDNGRFFARGSNRISFPPGIPFHRLNSLDDNWPYKRKTDYLFPQELGYRFEGYSLDKLKRPTFNYRYGDVQVTDFFEDLLDKKKNAFFRRTLTFLVDRDQEEFYFRAGAGKNISSAGKNLFQVDQLLLNFKGAAGSIVRDGDPQELLLRIKLAKGKTVLQLEYKW